MVVRAEFKTKVNIDEGEYNRMMAKTMIRDKIELGNPMVDLPVRALGCVFLCAPSVCSFYVLSWVVAFQLHFWSIKELT